MDIKSFIPRWAGGERVQAGAARSQHADTGRKSSITPYYPITELGQGSFQEFLLGHGRSFSAKRADGFYQSNSSIATAVDTVGDEVEMIRPVIEMPDSKLDEDHEILDLLKNPNPHDTYMQFIGQLTQDWLLNHDAYFVAVGNANQPPSALYAVRASDVEVKVNKKDKYPDEYKVLEGIVRGKYVRDEGTRRRVAGDVRRTRYLNGNLMEIYHIRKNRSRGNVGTSDSPLEAIALEVRQQIRQRHHNLAILERGGRLSLVAIFKDTMFQDQHNERHQSIQEQMGGADNAGKIAVISDGDMELQEFGKTNKDMDFLNLDQVAFKAVMNRYKIPLPLVMTDAATFNNVEAGVRMLYDRAVIPAFGRIAEGMSRLLVPRFRLDPSDFRITFNPEKIQALVERRLEQIQKRKELNLETPNELREMLPNREPLGPEGDFVYQPATLVPMGRDLFTEDNTTTVEEEARRLLAQEQQTDEDDD